MGTNGETQTALESDYPAEIAADRLDELRANPGRTVQVSIRVGKHPYVRYNTERECFEMATVSGVGYVEVETCDEAELQELFINNPVVVKPIAEATYSPPKPGESVLWQAVDDDVENVTHVDSNGDSEDETDGDAGDDSDVEVSDRAE
jgi:hypothetical protein